MKLISFTVGLLFCIHTCHSTTTKERQFYGKDKDDFNLTTVEIIRKYGYPAETHKMETEDGYILTVHRIPHGKNSTKLGFPILAAQSLFLDSAAYLLKGEKSLGFFLADAGYDVWLINFRGTHYTRTHKYLSAEESKFWDFSLHEFGVYDLPAQIDYICNHTKHEDILLLGYSMGATVFFIMGSERPEYQSKVRGAALLGPVATLKYSNAVVRFPFVPVMQIMQTFTKPMLLGNGFEDSGLLQNILRVACNATRINLGICKYSIFMLSGVDPQGFDEGTVLNLASHCSGSSSKVFQHYAQCFLTRKFRQFDYGVAKNWNIYKQQSPPEYHMQTIMTPMGILAGLNDIYGTPENIIEAFRGVRSVKSFYVIPSASFTHLDFIVGKDVERVLYPNLAKTFEDFLRYERRTRHTP